MEIICHRGMFSEDIKENSPEAFEKALNNGFGIETDLRDQDGEIVIAHDIPEGNHQSLDKFLEQYVNSGVSTKLALNIKSSGLAEKLKQSLNKFDIRNYFTFDQANPDMWSYRQQKILFFTRMSDHENEPFLLDDAGGVWLDEISKEWFNEEHIKLLVSKGKKICIVSPELHNRQQSERWQLYKKIEQKTGEELTICTDLPLEAENFFNG